MTEYGIWTNEDGGFTETQLYSREAADARLAEIVAEAAPEDRDTVIRETEVVEVCPYHNDQPAEDCDECMAEDDEDEDQ